MKKTRSALPLRLPFLPVLALLLSLSMQASAQKSHLALDENMDGFRFGIHASGGRCFQFGYNLISFQRFQTAYNLQNGGHLKSPLGDLQLKGGWQYGAGISGLSSKFISFSIDVIGGRQEGNAIAVLSNGDQRELKIVQKPVITNFDLIAHINKRLFLGMALGVEQANSTLFSGYRYANEFISYGTDQSLNGIFKSKDNRINIGLRADIAIVRQLRFSIRGEYCGFLAGKQDQSTAYSNTWSDQMYRQSASGGIHVDGDNHFYLPEDVKNINNADYYFVGLGETFAKTYKGWRVTTSLVFDLFTHHT